MPQNSDSGKIEIISLHPQEIKLLKYMKKWKYAEVTILVRDRLPVYVKKAIENVDLTKDS